VSEQFGFTVEEIPVQEIQNETVSSTKIRKALEEGHIQRANAYLEHHFIIQSGMHIPDSGSEQFSRPFFRIDVDDPNKLIPPDGSYAVSYLREALFHKGLVRIRDGQIILFPIDQESPLSEETFVHFHKQLAGGADDLLENEIEDVEELIY
jgi:hypothetical protein